MNTKSIQKATKSKNEDKSNIAYSTVEQLVKREVLGLEITNATTKEVLEYLEKIIKNSQKNIYVVTPNPEILLLSRKNKALKSAINNADLALCDGMQLFNAARFLDQPLKERSIGTDFVEKVCEKSDDWPITVGFLGGRPGVAKQASECLISRFPHLNIAFVAEEWSEEGFANAQKYHVVRSTYYGKNKNKNSDSMHNTKYILPNTVDVLFVAFGAPKQELWMAEHLNTIPVRVMVGVGGALDQIAHPSLRPPVFVHQLGLGWLYRLIHEPWRIKRQIKLIEFIWLVLKEKLQPSMN